MCGIAGVMALDGTARPPESLDSMLACLGHRGPDYTGRLEAGAMHLGHTRLSILDVSAAAHQPFASADGRWVIVYNGELYNFRALRTELAAAGRSFRTDGDTEVVLAAYLHWGADCLARMNGMFAFAIADLQAQTLFLARDRLGIKPLHYATVDGAFLFASEVKAVAAVGGVETRFDTRKLVELLMYRESIAEPLLQPVQSLPPGHSLSIGVGDAEAPTPRRWFHVAELPSAEDSARLRRMSRPARMDLLEQTLQAAVVRHLQSDVPVGTLCSGGVDSSLMTAMACVERPDISVYHVDIADCSERRWAEAVARHLDIDIHYFRLERDNYLARYVDCIYFNDAPLTHPQNIPIYYISDLARRNGCKVLLAGEGADETFGGYDWRYRHRRNHRHFSTATRLIHRLYRKALFMATGVWASQPVTDHRFKAWSDAGDVIDFCADQGFRRRLETDCNAAYGFVRKPADRETLAAMTADLRDYLGGILHQQDRASMQASIESRVPFLDIDVLRLAANLPIADKVSWRQSKRLIKALAYRYLPAEVIERPKVGFASPASDYVMGLGLGLFDDGFLQRDCALNRSAIADLLQRDPGNFAHMLYGLELWGRMFLRGESRHDLSDRLVGERVNRRQHQSIS